MEESATETAGKEDVSFSESLTRPCARRSHRAERVSLLVSPDRVRELNTLIADEVDAVVVMVVPEALVVLRLFRKALDRRYFSKGPTEDEEPALENALAV